MPIFDARLGCPFQGRRVLFDTNVWITIEGFDTRNEGLCYSDFFNELRDSDNKLIITDYVIGEFFNRCCKIEYELHKREFERYYAGERFPYFKRYRKSSEFKEFMTSMNDICNNIIDDCHYESVDGALVDIKAAITEASKGTIDFSDIMLREHCRDRDYVIVSHDFDFADCGLDFVTANERILARAD